MVTYLEHMDNLDNGTIKKPFKSVINDNTLVLNAAES